MSKKLDSVFNEIKRSSIPIDYHHQYDLIMARIKGEKTAPAINSLFNIKYASIAAMAVIIFVVSLSNINIIYSSKDESINEFLTSTFYLEDVNENDNNGEMELFSGNGTFI